MHSIYLLITITTVSCETVPICTPRANILLDRCFNAKLGDFGFSVELPRVVEDRTLLKARTFVRTGGYYPPELSEELYSPKSDVYSYGVVVTGCRYIDLDSAWPHFEGFMPWSSMVAWEQATFNSPGCQIVCTVFTCLSQ